MIGNYCNEETPQDKFLWSQLVKIIRIYQGTPSLAGRSLFQNSPPDCFEIHPLRSALYRRALPCNPPKALPLESAKGMVSL